jgi:large subunit ribosomal protein L24e
MNCSFCGKDIPRGTEMIFVNKRGKALYFCSSKCDKNMIKLGRKPRETKWTVAYREEKDIRIKGVPAQAVKEEAPVKTKPVEKAAPAPVEEKKVPAPKKANEAKEVKKEPKKEAKKKK